MLTAGLSGALASAISMATGAFLAERSEAEVGQASIARERQKIAAHPEREKEAHVRAHPLTDVWCGALNYQIEHHLFPIMARNRVARAHDIVREFCEERGIRYYQTSMLRSYREILGFLHQVGAPLRERHPNRPPVRAAEGAGDR